MSAILTIPAKTLKQRSKEITAEFLLSKKTQNFIKKMVPIMRAANGIGLAAPQIGENIRICVIAKEADKTLKNDLILINPIWEKVNKKTDWDIEGCLSVPKIFGKVKRYSNIYVTALDQKGNKIELDAKNLLARVIQHEVDHLNGILFIEKAKNIYSINDENKVTAGI